MTAMSACSFQHLEVTKARKMSVSIPRTPWATANLKVCLICLIATTSIYVLCEVFLAWPDVSSFFKYPSPYVQDSYKPQSFDVQDFSKLSSLDKPEHFKQRVSYEEIREMQDLVRTFSEAMRNASLTFFLIMGSLLGSWRHHGLVPWDDDVDLGILYRERDSMYIVLGNLTPHYFIDVSGPERWKFYSSRGKPFKKYKYSWPYVDITLYEQNSSRVWDPVYRQSSHPIDDVFPLRDRPYMGMMLPAPNDTEAVLKHYFQTLDLTKCKPSNYDHREERWIKISADNLTVPCEQLHNVYPFVWRQPAGGGLKGCNESLAINGSVLSWVLVNTTRC